MSQDKPSASDLCTARNQCIMLLLVALEGFDRPATKKETIGAIEASEWFDIRPEDREPYPSDPIWEPRWGKLIAWSRKDALKASWLIDYGLSDAWHISPIGKEELRRRLFVFQMRKASVYNCYLWTESFKKRIDPAYSWQDDAQRPKLFYDDVKQKWCADLLKQF